MGLPSGLIVIAPSFNNAATLRAVLDGVDHHAALPVIVVDDGSADATPTLLAAWAASPGPAPRETIRHPFNRGKAAALRSGFARASALGYTHALTLDTDAQHDPADVPPLLLASLAAPDAIILGTRPVDGEHYPFRSRLGRALSNALVLLIGGVRVRDSQCGLRVYPLHIVRTLGARTSRYAFETEVLARAGWANVPIVEVVIRCIYDVPGGRVTHFKVGRDTLSAVAMHTRMFLRSITPWPTHTFAPSTDATTTGTLAERIIRWLNPLRTWRKLRQDAAARARLAPALGVGIFIGIQPAFGFKTVLCLIIAKLMRVEPLVVMGASSLTTPPVGFIVWAASIVIGHLLLHGTLPTAGAYDIEARGVRAVLGNAALEWTLGALLLGTTIGLATWLITTKIFPAQSATRRVQEMHRPR